MPDQNLVNEVQKLRSQGISNDEIAQRLLYKGYTHSDVFDALSSSEVNPALEMPMEYTEQPMQAQYPEERIDTSKISEIAESIIEEKWSSLVDHVNAIIEWKSSVELKLAAVEEQVKGIKAEFDILHKSILGRIGETDTVMREVSTDIKALEQVFKKILPGFVENVNELSRITQSIKKK
jgi:hypothetical protein